MTFTERILVFDERWVKLSHYQKSILSWNEIEITLLKKQSERKLEMSDNITPHLNQINDWFSRKIPDTLQFNSGASREEIESAEKHLGVSFPASYRNFLLQHNGQEVVEDFNWLPGSGALYDVQTIIEVWNDEQAWYEGDPESFADYMDDDKIRFVIAHPKRIQISNSEYRDGDAMYIDYIPGPNGIKGQIIAMTSECEFEVVGANFAEFLEKYSRLLEKDRIHVSTEDDMINVEPIEDGEYSLVPLFK